MSFNIIPTAKFKKEAKRLAKKYYSLKTDLKELNDELTENPYIGVPLGNELIR